MYALKFTLLVVTFLTQAATQVFAEEIITTSDYLAITIEAEEFSRKDDRWVLTDSNTDQLPLDEDPDPNHSDSASGGIYFELLPDIRVTHNDPQFPPIAFWGRAGTGPEMHWDINVPEPGRYHVHARAFSTGTEDNGIHVGLNGEWPESGETLQFCTAGARAWRWSSAQRDSGGVGSCGVQKTLYLDFDTAGQHTVSVSAREDGFELDRLVLIKDLSGNTRTCSPTTATGINCRNGGIESVDGETDMAVTIVTDPVTIADGTDVMSSGNSFRISAIIENLDKFDSGENIRVTTDFAAGLRVRGVSPECTFEGQVVTCNLDSLEPTAPNEFHKFDMAIDVVDGGTSVRSITAVVENDLFESNHDNNGFTVNVQIADPNDDLTTDIGVSLSASRDLGGDGINWSMGDLGTLNLEVTNFSSQESGAVNVDLRFTDGVAVDLMPVECSGTNPITCSYLSLLDGESRSLEFEINAAGGGTQIITASTSVANDNDSSNNRDSVVLIFNDLTDPIVGVETPVDSEEPADNTEEPTDAEAPADNTDAPADNTDGPTDTDDVTDTDDGVTVGPADGDAGFPVDLIDPIVVFEASDSDEATEALEEVGSVIEPTTTAASSSGGGLSWQALIALLLFTSACVYGRHQRQFVAVRDGLRR